MASGYIGEHYVSTYILQRLYYSTSAVGSSGHNVYVENQLRRTNSYGGATYTYPSNSYISINGDRYNWNWSSGNYPSIPAYNTNWLTFCSRTVYVAHSSAVNVYVAGGNYNMGSYLSGDCGGNVYLDALYTAPAAPSASNLASDGTPHKAYSKVTSNGWGSNSSRRNFEIICGGSIKASDYNNSPASMYWTLPNGSNNQNACAVNTWYGRAVNNHVLWTDAGARYVATPSAPIFTITPGSGTSPQTAISATVTYKGGDQNSSTCNNGTIKRWQFARQTSTESGVPSAFQSDVNSSDTTKAYTWNKSNFATGNSYKFYVRTVNTLGGTSSTTSQVIYCPSGVSGSMTARTTESLTLKGTATTAGTINSSTGGTLSCYQIKWSTDKATVDAGGGTATNLQTNNTFTIAGLSNDQTIYYRVYVWNIYGLSNVSNTLSATTLPRYTPSLTNISATPLSPGAHVTFTIQRTGGLTPTELVVSSVEISRRPTTSSTYTTLKTITGLSLHADDSYTIQNAWNDVASSEGDYVYKLHLSNGTDVSDTLFTLQAPTSVTVSPSLASGEPIQIQAVGNAVSETQLYKWDLISVSTAQSKTLNTSSLSPTITTSNHLNYDTTYDLKMRAYNSYGLWRDSTVVPQKTLPRFQFYSVSKGKTKKADAIFKHRGTESKVQEVYFITKNALGSVQVGDDLLNKRLTFITQSLRYRPENIASMALSDGTKIAYAYDQINDVYKFGIWQGDNIIVTFHDGWNWQMTDYEFNESTIVTAVSSMSGNLNMSAAFSTTKCEDIPLWEQENITGYGRIFYYTDNTYTTTSHVDIPNQAGVNSLAASDSGNGGSKNLAKIVGTSSNGLTTSEVGGELVVSGKASDNWAYATQEFSKNLPAGSYTLSIQNTLTHSIDVRFFFTDNTNSTYSISSGNTTVSFTTNKAANKIRLLFGGIASGQNYSEKIKVQLESGSSATSFDPYYGGTPTSSWSATIDGVTITNENVKSVVLTSSTMAIPNYFLANSPRLQSVVMNNANTTSIGNYVCYNCDSLLTASLPSALTSIPSYVFCDCANFNKAITVPANVTSIGSYFMAFCVRQNQAVTLPSGLTTVCNYFMSGCGIFDQPITLPDSLTYIGDYFMSANLLFSRDMTLPSSLTHIGKGFLYNCISMTNTINIGSLAATIADSSNDSFSTTIDTAACYVTGISLKGTTVSNWLTRFAGRDTSPYRYLKEYVEPIIVDRNWDYDNADLGAYTIGTNMGDFAYLPYSDIWSLQETSMPLLASTVYFDMYENFDNYETAYDVVNSLPFTKANGQFYLTNDEDHMNQFISITDFGASADTVLQRLQIVKNPTMALQWTKRGSISVADGVNTYWQGTYDTPNAVYNPIVEWSGGIGTSTATITITATELEDLENPEDYYIATLCDYNGTTGIYLSGIDINNYDSATGTATIYAGICGGPLMLFKYVEGE